MPHSESWGTWRAEPRGIRTDYFWLVVCRTVVSITKAIQATSTRAVVTVLIALLTLATTGCFLLKTSERVDVVIAATDLVAGKQITEQDITITEISVSKITKDMPRKSSEVVGHTTKVPISRGQQILLSNLE